MCWWFTKPAVKTLACTLLVGFGAPVLVVAQHWHYSQYNFTEQRINPGMMANSRFARAMVNYRSQRTGGDFAINSNFLELTRPLLNPSTGQPWSAVSINLHRDRSSGIFVTQEAALAYAVAVRLSRSQQLGFGGRILYQARNVDFSGFFTGSQYVPDRGFNQAISNGEQLANLRTDFATFSTGLYWQQEDQRGLPLHYAGLALFDLNRPPDSFLPNDSRLPSTLTLNGGWQWWRQRDLRLYSDVLVTFSAGNTATHAGLRLQKALQPRQPKNTDRVELLVRYVPLRSGIVGIQIHQGNMSLGLSYDFPVFYRNSGNLGALEVVLQLRQLVLPQKRKTPQKTPPRLVPTKNPVLTRESNEPRTVPSDSTVAPALIPAPLDSVGLARKPQGTAKPGPLTQEAQVVKTRQLHFHFEFNSAELDEESEVLLEEFRAALQEDPDLRLRVEGFTDNVGHANFNQRLSQRRAAAVCHVLQQAGIDSERLEAVGRGEEMPLNANSTEEERAKNRRVVLTLYRKQ
jgi:type IX secretion system PorP/SprF family membrane protein